MKRHQFRDSLRGSSSNGLIFTGKLIRMTNSFKMAMMRSRRGKDLKKCIIGPEILLMIIWNNLKSLSKHHNYKMQSSLKYSSHWASLWSAATWNKNWTSHIGKSSPSLRPTTNYLPSCSGRWLRPTTSNTLLKVDISSTLTRVSSTRPMRDREGGPSLAKKTWSQLCSG